jgi:5-methyltetrahydrofolate--homocysteine methyltransferase
MSDLNEVKAAYEGIRSVSELPISATMTFDTHGHTMMGVKPTKAIETFQDLDLVVLGANCGNGPDEIEEVISAMHAINPKTILVAKANAGLPKLIKGEVVYDGTPEIMAAYALRVHSLGATLIGGCCGSTPDHIEAIAKALQG